MMSAIAHTLHVTIENSRHMMKGSHFVSVLLWMVPLVIVAGRLLVLLPEQAIGKIKGEYVHARSISPNKLYLGLILGTYAPIL